MEKEREAANDRARMAETAKRAVTERERTEVNNRAGRLGAEMCELRQKLHGRVINDWYAPLRDRRSHN